MAYPVVLWGRSLRPGELGLVPTATPRVGPCAAPQEQGLGEVCKLSHPQWFCVSSTWHRQSNPISTALALQETSHLQAPAPQHTPFLPLENFGHEHWMQSSAPAEPTQVPRPCQSWHMQQGQRRLLRVLGFVKSWKTGRVSKRPNSQQSTPVWSTEGSPEPGKSQGSSGMWVLAYPHQLMGLPSQPASW